jgi:hypothetical protein
MCVMISKLFLVAASAAALTGAAALAQTPHQISGPTIPQRQGIDPASVASRDPVFWTDPTLAGNLNNPDSRTTVVTTYVNPPVAARSDTTPPADYPAPSPEPQAQAATPASADVAAVVASEPSFTEPSFTTEVIASAPVPDTRANRARYGQPMSNAGKRTAPRGN